MRRESAIELACGPRAAEARLLALLVELHAGARADPSLLARPVRVIVPSRSLRLHLSERIAAQLGATLGVAVQTLHATALEILERAGQQAGGGDALVEVLVRRLARGEPALREACEPFRDGYRPVLASVRDLLDAGLEPELVEPLAERLAETRVPAADLRRGQAVLRVAGAVAGELLRRGHAGRPFLLARAREVFLADPERRLPARALIVHGFADLTGRAADLVEALVARAGGRVLIDRPPDPAAPAKADLGAAFTARLVGRLQGAAGQPRELPERAEEARVACFRAPGAAAEVREVARRLRQVLADGTTRPERCAVVARDLGPYRGALRTHFTRLGLPFSGLRASAPMDGAARRLAALLELLEQGPRTGADRWLDAVRRPRPAGELRLGLRLRGGLRLEQVPGVRFRDESPDSLDLPLRRGVGRRADRPGDAGAEATGPARFVAFYSKLKRSELEPVQALAAGALARFERWTGRARFARHLAQFQELRAADLGWRPGDPEERRIRGALGALAEGLADEELDREEFLTLVSGAVRAAAEAPLAGEGGGVQVLDVMEARARTFEHLFVLGLQRGSFPRQVREDALFGDDLRRALAELLPEIPIKARGRDEERYLFAQLVAASPRVTLSWQMADDDGRPRVVSPLLVRLLGEEGDAAVEQAAAIDDPAAPGPRTAHEAAVRGGLELRTVGYSERLQAALEETGLPREDAAELARVRARILEAFERGPFDALALAPWLGLLGAQDEAGIRPDPRAEPIFVTQLESLSRCPWQTVLTRFLRLARQPDPVEELPAVDQRVVGNVVHRVLEEIDRACGVPKGGPLAEVLAREGWLVEWPRPERFDALLYSIAGEELGQERVPLAGHVRLLAECARDTLARARAFLEADAGRFEQVRVLGVEVAGQARVPLAGPLGADLDGPDAPAAVAIDFKADRVERREGRVVLSDYKTGRPKEEKSYASELAAGRALQPAVYTLAADGGVHTRGRYLYLRAEPEQVEVGRGVGIGPHAEPFAQAVRTIVGAWNEGALFPRLVDQKEKEPDACRYCEVSAACLRGDSGARRALLALAREGSGAPQTLARLFELEPKGAR